MYYDPLEPVMRKVLGDLTGQKLKFTQGNAKLDGIGIFSLPAGWACPGAHECQSRTVVNKDNAGGFGIKDGPSCQFRCFAATDEAKYPATRNARWHNLIILKDCKTMEKMIVCIKAALPLSKWGAPIRLHVAGDFFSQSYFDAWLAVAKEYPKQIFYAYTKSLPFWVARLGQIPSNFRLTASEGGKWDELIAKHNLRSAKVVYTVERAKELGLEIDHDDSHAYGTGGNFALLLHGTQPEGTPAAKAWSALKAQGIGGYYEQKGGRAKVAGGTPPAPYPIEMIVDGVVEIGV